MVLDGPVRTTLRHRKGIYYLKAVLFAVHKKVKSCGSSEQKLAASEGKGHATDRLAVPRTRGVYASANLRVAIHHEKLRRGPKSSLDRGSFTVSPNLSSNAFIVCLCFL